MAVPVYLESGRRRVFAVAVDWPGWARSGRDEAAALAGLAAYRDRYRAAVGTTGGRIPTARTAAAFEVVERVEGGGTTDMGAPGTVPALDAAMLSDRELDRLIAVLRACWATFDAAAGAAAGRRWRTGPRGGGRSLEAIVAHVHEGDGAYTGRLGGSWAGGGDMTAGRAAFETALRRRAAGEIPDRGPRGGLRWPPRYAVRRDAWHALDHAWEIEDRAGGPD